MKLIIDIDDEVYSHAKDYEHRLITPNESNILRDSIANGTPLPKDATNGDIIKALFPSMETFRTSDVVEIRYKVHDEVWCVSALDIVWWDEPYKRGEEDGKDKYIN